MSFDLAVWHESTTAEEAPRKYAELTTLEPEVLERHPRAVAFHRDLTARYPELADVPADELGSCPWATAMTVAGDGVVMSMSWSCSDAVVEYIQELARRHGLVLYDPQDGTAYPPGAAA
ncbi:hypothetical protein VA596_50210 [Amycolatopsis sp., V23-08]|uniref:Uncharacterized protein n=1 Tax=Amycolatopsis heterodermiae TaxID=3110235 RepID=A0ABU5RN89_9PSEU|nr:hypothetical protein [Amycolatopsis sp., V23-08]MEA5367787.1 hypothetical protein [Amycolatopsis sp., V23-08]